ncbi:serine protease inhibitor Kazal-type 1-like [Clarias gariepinus]|uniref:serine protease inhibitor Kazal-type 1-like n=1 Tax=Clarias gariepinus TaxID=13013 RepID=UPI00234C8D44|nr:serine protease inhibitor Kazal-type 1-like [Clarias gariepinus]XP_053352204.1 serine protease inhibitor Kazal-type 1-like [Clarias gariepinus]
MKLLLLIGVSVLICLDALTALDDATPRQANCENYKTDACPRNLMPVCGDNGKTYANECLLCVESRNQTQTILVVKDGDCSADKP